MSELITADLIRLARVDARQAVPPFDSPGFVVTNPPYGERIELLGDAPPVDGDADGEWRDIGRAMKTGFGGWKLWVLTSDLSLSRRLGMKERRRAPLYNGALECRLFGFEIFAPAVRP